MALEPCHECGEDISEHANTCPHCGIDSPFQGEFERGLENFRDAADSASSGFWGLAKLVFWITGLVWLWNIWGP